jgi:hypothetical protein
LSNKGPESEISQEHRTALERQDALFSYFLDETHMPDQKLESLIADLDADAVAIGRAERGETGIALG